MTTTIHLGPDDGYPEGTRIVFSMEPTTIFLDSPDGTTTEVVATAHAITYRDRPQPAPLAPLWRFDPTRVPTRSPAHRGEGE